MTRILLVDDSIDILFLLQTELELVGFTVRTAADAMSALEIVQHFRPDVIVSDLQMPGMDGYELIRRVRAIPELAAVAAIALTGRSMGEEVRPALSSGFDAFLTKPVEGKTLVDTVNQQTGKVLKKAF
jgi:CheY-like chemotaxis protein